MGCAYMSECLELCDYGAIRYRRIRDRARERERESICVIASTTLKRRNEQRKKRRNKCCGEKKRNRNYIMYIMELRRIMWGAREKN